MVVIYVQSVVLSLVVPGSGSSFTYATYTTHVIIAGYEIYEFKLSDFKEPSFSG